MPFGDFAGTGGKPVELYHFSQADPATVVRDWYWTSADSPITATIPGVNAGAAVTFQPAVLVRGRVTANEEARTQNVDVTTAGTFPIAALFRAGAPSTPVALTIYGWQRDDTTAPTYATLFAGQVKTAVFFDDHAALTCGPYQDLVQRKLLTVLAQPTCNNTLYGVRCGVARTGRTSTGTVAGIGPTAATLALDDTLAAAFANDLATYGRGRLIAGVAIVGAERGTIIAQDCVAGTITLLVALAGAAPGDALTVSEGCDKLADTCYTQFLNFANFQGFRDVPTRNPFDGSIV